MTRDRSTMRQMHFDSSCDKQTKRAQDSPLTEHAAMLKNGLLMKTEQ